MRRHHRSTPAFSPSRRNFFTAAAGVAAVAARPAAVQVPTQTPNPIDRAIAADLHERGLDALVRQVDAMRSAAQKLRQVDFGETPPMFVTVVDNEP